MKKISNKSDYFIFGIFSGCVVTILYFALWISYTETDFKFVAAPSISGLTLLFGVFSASKVLKWHESKKNDKGFSMAESIVMSTYNCLMVVVNLEQLIIDSDVINTPLNEFKKERILKILETENDYFKVNHNVASVSNISLYKWNIEQNKEFTSPLHTIIDLYECLYNLLDRAVKDMLNDEMIYESTSIWHLLNTKLAKEMEIYNKLSINDIYLFNN
ncbi:hypothetical protein [Rouxiella badensis]|uniref:hypothetical protein n=1 Tax=Rouxiella badensis TaxID=1646377 RepID=UPI0022AA04AE|nr:hypothetical protein [Rouxiella badensis]WAT08859.1 hypothetical protein O1V65_21990 [Rouxiella badensis]